MVERVLDRIVQFDERSRGYNAAAVLPEKPPRSYTWSIPIWLDQGEEGACVGFWNAHDLAARPVQRPADAALALRLYKIAQDLDGQDWVDGTSMIAGAKASKQLDFIREYRWCFTLKDALMTLAYKGPIGLGINVYSSMFRTDSDGFWRISGQVEGGHAIIAYKIKLVWQVGVTAEQKRSSNWLSYLDWDKSYIQLRNSWGIKWGHAGDVKLSIRNFDRLRRESGEVLIYTVRL